MKHFLNPSPLVQTDLPVSKPAGENGSPILAGDALAYNKDTKYNQQVRPAIIGLFTQLLKWAESLQTRKALTVTIRSNRNYY